MDGAPAQPLAIEQVTTGRGTTGRGSSGRGTAGDRGAPASRRTWLARARRRHPLLTFLAVRILAGLATLLAASVVIFLATQLLPGDPASVVLGRSATPQALQELQARLGLDQLLPAQYLAWLGDLLHGDFGDSATQLAQGSEVPISSLLGDPLTNTVVLAVLTVLVMIPVSLLLGILAGIRAGKAADHSISIVSLALSSLPEFVVGALLLLVFFTGLGILPPIAVVPPGESPLAHPDALVMPVLTLVIITSGWGIRQIRAGVIDASDKGFVVMSRLNGIPERRVVRRYIVRNSLATSVQVIAQNVQYLVGGIIIVEAVFAYSGLGKLLVDAVDARDFRQVQAVAMIIAAFYVAVNIVADLLVTLLVPRLRSAWG